MTTKDQAIAPTSAEYAMGYAEGFNDACKPPAPDCRTCLHGRQGDGIWQCDKCVMGDQYQPAPKVVLWRTE